MKEYSRLYALDKNGRIRVFILDIIRVDKGYDIVSYAGLSDGKKSATHRLVTEGKAGRSLEEQTILVADAMYSDKLDEGYKSIETIITAFPDLAKRAYSPEELIRLAIKFNTSSTWTPLPMLANKYKKFSGSMFAQPKLDGVRCLVTLRDGEAILCSRGGKIYNLPHISEAVKSFLERAGTILDGELYVHGVPQNEISGAARRNDGGEWLQYWVYDIASQIPQRQRIGKLDQLADHVDPSIIKIIQTSVVYEPNMVDILHDKYVTEGFEGLILRDMDAPYEFSFRSNYLLKYKKFIEKEFIITGVEVDGNVGISSFVFKLKYNSQPFKARAIGSHEQWQHYYDNPPVGKKATLRFFNWGANGVPEKAVVKSIRDYE